MSGDIVQDGRRGSYLDAGLAGYERRRVRRAESAAVSFVEHEQAHEHSPWSLVARGHELPDTQPALSGNGRSVVEERPAFHLISAKSPEAEARRRRVLVVDDDVGARKLRSAILELAAIEVIEAADGRAGLVARVLSDGHPAMRGSGRRAALEET